MVSGRIALVLWFLTPVHMCQQRDMAITSNQTDVDLQQQQKHYILHLAPNEIANAMMFRALACQYTA